MKSTRAERRISAAASRRRRNSATIVAIADRDCSCDESAHNAACCASVLALDVVCDWSAEIERVTVVGAIDQPRRQPVIAYALATPSMTTRRSRSADSPFAASRREGAGDS